MKSCKGCNIEMPKYSRSRCNPCRYIAEKHPAPDKKCEYCGILCRAKGKRFFCSIKCRLLGYMTIDPVTNCWNYREKWRDDEGYGKFFTKRGKKRTTHRATRISYQLFKGEIPEGLYVCHACDNPPCINPDHLWIGNNQENQLDRFNKKFIV